ncbi:transcriptional repressor LexA [Candidatus Sumerlaeota bacterium]
MYLTKRQREALGIIQNFVAENGYAPSLAEIAQAMGLRSIATVHKHLENLARKGLILRGWNRGRSIELLPEAVAARVVEVPLLGRVAAGEPIEAVEDAASIGLPQDFVSGPETYVLRVSGDSMIDEKILDGDYIIVQRRATADDGQVVVARIKADNTVTVKTFHRDGERIRLQPANEQLPPMFFAAHELEVQGIVIGLLRKYQ